MSICNLPGNVNRQWLNSLSLIPENTVPDGWNWSLHLQTSKWTTSSDMDEAIAKVLK
jgi:hypothetical protein